MLCWYVAQNALTELICSAVPPYSFYTDPLWWIIILWDARSMCVLRTLIIICWRNFLFSLSFLYPRQRNSVFFFCSFSDFFFLNMNNYSSQTTNKMNDFMTFLWCGFVYWINSIQLFLIYVNFFLFFFIILFQKPSVVTVQWFFSLSIFHNVFIK